MTLTHFPDGEGDISLHGQFDRWLLDFGANL
jgi:hypothetical protein